MVKPKKYLGQHFLHDRNIAQKIVQLLKPAKTIIEVGSGTGALSTILFQLYKEKVLFFDIDAESIEFLHEQIQIPTSQLYLQDFLTVNLNEFIAPIHIIGNFPYNISSSLLFKILENKHLVSQVVCMLQKEVAQRICAKEGNKMYGILSVLIQTYYDVLYHFQVNESVFVPPPKVKSAVIELRYKNDAPVPLNEEFFFAMVKASFNKRRKILSNSLSDIIDKKYIPEKYATKRPEMLSVSEFLDLSNQLYLKIRTKS
ncbi:MAG: 16S rRNA (adenine(1518)-N(6)/adenine(1519)-N(6))-dimethyltransferase RsmA [Bacteroidales bacterium]|nr:16S rRNA (adenine(1518)-N(6)/adenine(1519)-N(6))-dimethyltransferase RsmA [Bacteroidales bacterium]